MKLTETARHIFQETLRRLAIEDVMRAQIRQLDEHLVLGDLEYFLPSFNRIVVISIGKAGIPMCESLLSVVSPALRRNQLVEALVVSSYLPDTPNPRIQYLHGNHPLPGYSSRQAADAILDILRPCDEKSLVFFLISGGSSAMVEEPLSSDISLEEAAQFHQTLVHSGLPITQMNILRKHFSRVKGGRLAVAAGGATQCTLLLSDVPADAPHIVGSGPSLPDPSTVEDSRKLLVEHAASLKFSAKILAFFRNPNLEETPKSDHPAFEKTRWITILSSDDLSRVSSEIAAHQSFHVVVDNSCDDWEYRRAAAYLIERLEELHREHGRVCLLSTGEVSVQISSRHGIGGRNQQFALECARLLHGRKLRAAVLSGGSDGIDGNSSAAGAVCDETTAARAFGKSIDISHSLDQFNSFPLFQALDDLIVTGPTGNNLRDLRILLIEG